MQSRSKRDIQINVRVSPEEWTHLKKAADTIWPGAEVTNAGIMLGLAKRGADTVLGKKKEGKEGKKGT